MQSLSYNILYKNLYPTLNGKREITKHDIKQGSIFCIKKVYGHIIVEKGLEENKNI